MSDVNSEAPVNSEVPINSQVPFENDASQHSPPATNTPTNSPSPLSNQNAIDLEEESNTTCEGTKRKPSVVWEHFKKQQVNGVWKAICNYCNKHLGGDSKNGTRHLHDHHKSCTRKKVMDMRQKVLTNNFSRESPKMNSYIFYQDFARKELSHAIILHEYPLSIVDHVGFKRYSAALQPLFKVPSRNTIKSDILKIYDYETVKTLSLVEHNKSRVAITTDMWTASNQKKGFMAVTSHFIDDSWTLQSRILRFIYVPYPHTKEVLCDTLLECMMDWNIDRKILTGTVDNCSTNDAMITMLMDKLSNSSLLLGDTLFHMRCCAHILNLIVKDGLDVIRVGVEKIRESVAYWTATPKRLEKFEETVNQLRIPHTKKLGLDCATKWNSTYLMLQTALLYKDVFSRLKIRKPQYKTVLTEQEWKFAREISGRFKIFFSITELFSGTKYPTVNVCFPALCEIRMTLSQWLSCEIEVIRTMASKMVKNFDKYWLVIHGVIGVAVALDPRYKMSVLEFYFEKLYGDKAEDEVDRVRHICYDLLQEYQHRVGMETDVVGDSSTHPEIVTETLSEFDLFISRKRSKKMKNVRSELDHYLEDDVLPRTSGFDVLNWWKASGPKYPTLQAIARDILAIPVSTVASESAFNTSRRLVSPHRSRLHPNTLEALMCAQSWLWGAEMKGNSTLESVGYTTIYDDDEIESDQSCATFVNSS